MPTPERSPITVVFCDVQGFAADAVTVDALARLQIAARRQQCQLSLRGASNELRELVAFMGLCDVLPCCERSVDVIGQAE